MPITVETKASQSKINPGSMLARLDAEWNAIGDPSGLQVAYHAGVRTALPWVGGDPFGLIVAREYVNTRLARLCAYLVATSAKPGPEQWLARDKQADRFVEVAELYHAACPCLHVDEFQLDPNGWPTFSNDAAEDYHLNCLAIFFLNRLVRNPLADLTVSPF